MGISFEAVHLVECDRIGCGNRYPRLLGFVGNDSAVHSVEALVEAARAIGWLVDRSTGRVLCPSEVASGNAHKKTAAAG